MLLAISAVWCHWCHVMDETTYSHPGVIERLNRDYIPVRVDNDQRPDVNARYNQGGWPTAAFLSAGGDLLTGATYVPPEQFISALDQVSQHYREHRLEIEQPKPAAAPAPSAPTSGTSEEPDVGLIEDLVRRTLGQFDVRHGGFGQGQKFPHVSVLRQLVSYVAEGGAQSQALLPDLVRTLDAMAQGELLDGVAGGFFRYCTQRDWRVPHFEKMLEDNAGLLALYSEAAMALKAPRYLEPARAILRFLDSVLWDPGSHLYRGSQDADEVYFKLGAAEREGMTAPYVDPVLYASWNALAVVGLLRAAAALDAAAPLGRATEIVEALAERFVGAEGAVAHFDAGHGAELRGLLTDQVQVAQALLLTHQATGDPTWREVALRIWAWTNDHLAGRTGALNDHAGMAGSEAALARPFEPIPENGLAAELALMVETITGEAAHRETARRLLLALQPTAERLSAEGGSGVLFAADYAAALQRYGAPPYELHLVATPASGRELAAAALSALPAPTVVWIDPHDAGALSARGYPPAEVATAYLCDRWACQPPVTTRAELVETIARVRERPHPA